MNQVNMAVDVRYQSTESKKNTKTANDDKDAFRSFLEERHEAQDISKKPLDKKEQDSSDSAQPSEASNEAAMLWLQMGQILPEGLVLKGMPEETAETVQLVQPVQTAVPVDEDSSLTVPVMNGQNMEQMQSGAEIVDNEKSSGKEAGIILDGIKPEETKETTDIKLPEGQLKSTGEEKTESKRLSEEQPEDTAPVVENTVNPEAVQTVSGAVSNVRHDSNVQEHQVTEHIQVSKPEEIPQKLTEELMVKTSKGVKEFEIQIEPGNLGKIAIKVNYEQGQTVISILCTEKKTLDLIGLNAKEIGYVMEQNLGDTTTIYVDKQENDYLHQNSGGQDHTGRDSEQERQREENHKNQTDDSQQFIQKLRLGLER